MPQTAFVYFDIGGAAVLDFSVADKWTKLINTRAAQGFEWQAFLYDSSSVEKSSSKPVPLF
ncbi:MAG: hypothetical protein M1528_01975 [Candidatus Marsarchaeota archaeon]|jgi:hypothetical protein|nr:hypothetical protein [Candidatus Marsarchaeota archaeon]MCL5115277.1 hypothetical protein [Candidatus Marsarchaeota archaeon]